MAVSPARWLLSLNYIWQNYASFHNYFDPVKGVFSFLKSCSGRGVLHIEAKNVLIAYSLKLCRIPLGCPGMGFYYDRMPPAPYQDHILVSDDRCRVYYMISRISMQAEKRYNLFRIDPSTIQIETSMDKDKCMQDYL